MKKACVPFKVFHAFYHDLTAHQSGSPQKRLCFYVDEFDSTKFIRLRSSTIPVQKTPFCIFKLFCFVFVILRCP